MSWWTILLSVRIQVVATLHQRGWPREMRARCLEGNRLTQCVRLQDDWLASSTWYDAAAQPRLLQVVRTPKR